jgi:hypothetical protein
MAIVDTRLRQIRILRQKPIPRMDRIRPMQLRDINQSLNIQIRLDRLPTLRRPDRIRLIGLKPMERESIFVAINRDRNQF